MHETGFRNAPLTQLHLHLSDGCDLACRHCWLRQGSARSSSPQFLPVDLALRAVNEALPLGLRSVRLSGYQTLLHPDLGLLLGHLENLELAITIETNGAGMTSEHALRLAALPQRSVIIPLDGAAAETHDAIHGQAGAFETTTQAIRSLADAGLSPQVIYAVVRRNASQLAAAVRLIEKLGGASLRFSPVQASGGSLPARRPVDLMLSQPGKNGHNVKGLVGEETLEVAELIALGRRVERDLSHGTRLRLLFDQPPAFRGLHPQARVDGQGRCGIMNILGILSTGEYALCGVGQSIPELVFGRVGKDRLEQVWNTHPTLQLLRAGMPERLEGVCERCVMKSACLGNCVAENFIRSGSFWGPHWFCASAEQMGLFPAGRLIENRW